MQENPEVGAVKMPGAAAVQGMEDCRLQLSAELLLAGSFHGIGRRRCEHRCAFLAHVLPPLLHGVRHVHVGVRVLVMQKHRWAYCLPCCPGRLCFAGGSLMGGMLGAVRRRSVTTWTSSATFRAGDRLLASGASPFVDQGLRAVEPLFAVVLKEVGNLLWKIAPRCLLTNITGWPIGAACIRGRLRSRRGVTERGTLGEGNGLGGCSAFLGWRCRAAAAARANFDCPTLTEKSCHLDAQGTAAHLVALTPLLLAVDRPSAAAGTSAALQRPARTRR
mmetsp:Transcript_94007/g.201766  ORF Transcript_94007/g.201766 Transcript_94007/m.201766 type:complete len:276 (+) Transcript_94007:1044-1871(+)